MRAKIGALVAAVAAAASTAGAAAWAKRKKGEKGLDQEVGKPVAGAAKAAGTTKAADAPDAADDLTSIKGVGAARAESLRGIGVTTFAQIADWSDEDIDVIAPQIKVTADRVRREDWVGQARAVKEG